MTQIQILSEINSLEVKHSSLLGEYLECDTDKEKELYSELMELEKKAKDLVLLLN